MSKHLLQLAQAVQVQFNSDTNGIEAFKSDCNRAEEYSRDKHDIVPRLWVQAKSNIVASMLIGMDLSKFSTESAMRKELNSLRKENSNANITVLPGAESKSPTLSASAPGQSHKASTEATIEANTTNDSDIDKRVNPLFADFMKLIDTLPRATQDSILKGAMTATRKEISKLIKKQPVKVKTNEKSMFSAKTDGVIEAAFDKAEAKQA